MTRMAKISLAWSVTNILAAPLAGYFLGGSNIPTLLAVYLVMLIATGPLGLLVIEAIQQNNKEREQ